MLKNWRPRLMLWWFKTHHIIYWWMYTICIAFWCVAAVLTQIVAIKYKVTAIFPIMGCFFLAGLCFMGTKKHQWKMENPRTAHLEKVYEETLKRRFNLEKDKKL